MLEAPRSLLFRLSPVCSSPPANLCACWFLHHHVRRQLNARNFYSDTAIVRLFATNLDYYRRAWHPESIESHGSAQNHLLYRDQSMKVSKHTRSDRCCSLLVGSPLDRSRPL